MVQIPRLHYFEELSLTSEVLIVNEQHHYLTKVLRSKIGDEISLFNSKDGQWLAKMFQVDKSCIKASIIRQEAIAPKELGPTLYFAPIKNVTTSFIVQKATELGASIIQPIKTRYSVVDKVNIEKLRLVAIEATEQCERFTVPEINNIVPIEKIINSPICKGPLLFCNENQTGDYFIDYCIKERPKAAGIIIGPEGGFSSEEIHLLENNCVNVQLGSRILRSETAIIAALSIYQAIVENRSEK